MKIKSILCCLVMFPLSALGNGAPKDPNYFRSLERQLDHGDIGDYCYMGSAYVVVKNGADIISTSVIWNHDTNRPLRCNEYDGYVAKKTEQYNEDLKKYRETNPATVLKKIKK